jgi:hypothetical protein
MKNQVETIAISKNNDMGVPRISAAFENLWESAASRLDDEELEWYSGFVDTAQNETANLASIIMQLGCLIGNEHNTACSMATGCFQRPDSVSELLFSLSFSLDTITGLLHIGDSAQGRLKRPDLYKPKAGLDE